MLPFAGGPSATENGLLIISAVAALLYAAMLAHPVSWRRSAAKTLSTVLLCLIAWQAGGPLLLAAGLALSAAGDWFLSRDGEAAFMGGLVSFLAGHVAYIALFWPVGALPPMPLGPGLTAIVVTLMAVHALFMARRLLPAVGRELRIPVAVYIAAIFLMGATAAFQNLVVLAGAILFMASDTALATGRFLLSAGDGRQKALALFVWLSYYAAQLLILLGVLKG